MKNWLHIDLKLCNPEHDEHDENSLNIRIFGLDRLFPNEGYSTQKHLTDEAIKYNKE